MNINGDATELLVASALKRCGLKHVRNKRYVELSSSSKKYLEKENIIECTDAIVQSGMLKSTGAKFFRMEPYCMHKRDTCDIMLLDSARNDLAGISIKHQHQTSTVRSPVKTSVRHQRPSNLPTQMSLSAAKTTMYRDDYGKVTKRWHARWKKNGIVRYSEIDRDEKTSMYRQINRLTKKTLENGGKQALHRYLSFLLDTDTRYVVQCSLANRHTNVYTKRATPHAYVYKSGIRLELEGNAVKFILKDTGELLLSMRLHTSTTNIGNTLRLKYDTTTYLG